MAERQLTATEIDDLLSVFKGGRPASASGEFASLDLNRPSRIPKPTLESLQIRHEQAAKSLRHDLRVLLRKDVTVKLNALEQDRFGVWRESLEEPCCGFVIEMAPLKQPAYVVLDYTFAFAGLDRLLGGDGDPRGQARDMTATEAAVLEEILTPILAAHVTTWAAHLKLQPRILRAFTIPRFLRELRHDDPILVASYRLGGFAEGAGFQVVLPLAGLEPHLQHVRTQDAEPARPLAAPVKEKVLQQLQRVHVGLSVCIGRANIPVREILGLGEGDVIVLDRNIQCALELLVEGLPKFQGFLHRRGQRLVMRVDKRSDDASSSHKEKPTHG